MIVVGLESKTQLEVCCYIIDFFYFRQQTFRPLVVVIFNATSINLGKVMEGARQRHVDDRNKWSLLLITSYMKIKV